MQTETESRLAVGEIVEASTTGFRAVASRPFEPPPFGAFVKAVSGQQTTYAVVSNVSHGSIDPARRAIPLGQPWEELRRSQPQVAELLATEMDALCVAFRQGDGPICHYLPPAPPRVHDFVYLCDDEEVRALTVDTTFVRTLAACGLPVAGELVAAAIRSAAAARPDGGRSFLLRAGREVADLYRQDYEQARAVLRRLGLRVAGEGWQPAPPDRTPARHSEK